jgi:hypothetical protein
MAKVPGIVKQLKKERDKVERQLSGLNAALSAFIGAYKTANPTRSHVGNSSLYFFRCSFLHFPPSPSIWTGPPSAIS